MSKDGSTASADRRPKPLPSKKDRIEAFYDIPSGSYYAMNVDGEFQPFESSTFKLLLRERGFWASEKYENGLSYLEAELLRITREQTVHFTGTLGGFDVGRFDVCGYRVLVTRGPNFIEPKPGKFDTLGKFLRELLGDQLKYFLGWIKWALTSLRNGLDWSPGQLLAIAGGRNSGKSMLQTLITPMLGGRSCSPYDYLIGKNKFNDQVFGAEHGLIGDQNHRTDYASRRAFGSSLKTMLVNREQKIEGKFKTEATLMPFIRLSLTLNDNPEALLVLPPLDTDVADKIMLLKASPANFPFPSAKFPTQQSFMEKLRSELPQFLHWLRTWRIPGTLKDGRYGIVSFHHPELVDNLYDLSPELRLWQLIETYLFKVDFPGEWEGTSSDLQSLLEDRCKGRETRTVLPYSSACGQYLSKLAHRFGEEAKAAGGGLKPAVIARRTGKNKIVFSIRESEVIEDCPPPLKIPLK